MVNANAMPEEIAIVDCDGNRKTTWKELDTLICQIADYAIRLGLTGVIPVVQGRTMEYIATVLGLNLAGLAVSPLSDDYPSERIEYIKTDLGAQIIADSAFVECSKEVPACDFIPRCTPDGIAWVIYTSGSIGRPKGVIYINIGICSECLRLALANEMSRETVSMATSSLSFCASLVDIYTQLCCGGTVHLASEECRKDKHLLERYLLGHAITHAFISPRMLSKMHLELPAMKVISTAGEKVSGISPRNYKVHVFYGMTESIASATYFVLDQIYENTPIGKPLPGMDIILLDGMGNPADEGEICITGCLAAGYWNLPELTAQVFSKNPFSDDPEHGILLHTGDIGRRLPDGNFLFLNRNDWMIKINGQRVEPGEVEFQIKTINGVTEAVVKGFTNAHGQAYLSAWYTAGEDVTEEIVKTRLANTLAAYMMPAFIIKIDAFSTNINGKLDRNVLTAPDASIFRTAFEAPETEQEKALCKGFQKILGFESIGRNDDFFSLGGDSIQVVSLCAELEKYGLKSSDIFKGRTPKGIATLLKTECEDKAGSYKESDESYPLTAGQTGVYYACINKPESLMYNLPFACILPIETDSGRLSSAIEKVLNSYSAFGTRFQVIDGEPRMLKQSAYVDIQSMTAREADMADNKKRFISPFDIEKGELARFRLIKTELSLHLLADIHHIIFDGSSVSVFFDAIAKAYTGGEIPPETISIYEAACMEHDAVETEEYKKAEKFFIENISKNDFESALTSDSIDDSENTTGIGKTVESYFDTVANSTQMECFARKNGITEATVFMGAFAWALSKLSGSEGFRFCTADNGRHTALFDGTVGMLVHTLPIAVSIDEAMSPGEYLRSLSTLFYETMRHDIYPFFKMSGKLGISNDTMFVYQADMLNHFNFCNREVELEQLDTGFALSKLSVQIFKTDEGYRTTINYRGDLYTENKIQNLVSLMKSAVSGFLKDQLLKDIPLVNHTSVRLLDSFCGENTEYEPCSVVDMLHTAMKQYPDNIAIVSGEIRINYRELDEITDRLAAYIIRKGIGKEDVVAILLDRNEMMAICPVAVVKAGAMYQPLDSTYPADRLTFMVKDSGAKLLITPKKLRYLVETDVEEFFTEDIEKLPERGILLPKPASGDAFVILYTSGSTGNPKGCVLEHKNFVHFLRFYNSRFSIDSLSSVAAYASFGFDANMMDLFSTFCAGATLYIIPEDMRLELDRLNRYFDKNCITHAFMTTQVGRQFATSVDNHSLRYLILGGEALTPIAPPKNYTIVNGYGPTETTCGISLFDIDRLYQSVPLGKPNSGVKVYVVDKQFRRVPVGMPGELCIAGPQVSRGYLNLPGKTAEGFIENPFTDKLQYKRMYRTGDIVCFLPDGNLQFIGRKDSQVKIRGFRIELTEVEEVIRRFEGIKDATVVAFDDAGGGKYLAAYVVSDNEVNIDELNDFIRSEKPAYMVPAVTMQIGEIPLNQNQKVNKKALPKPERKVEGTTPPQNEAQQKIFDLVSDVLGYQEFGINNDLFYAGLTSISSVRLISMLSGAFDRSLSMAELKENNTVEKLEKFLATKRQEKLFDIREEYPLTKTQEGIFYECMNKPESTFYNVPYLIKLGRGIDVERLRTAIADTVNAHPYLMTTMLLSDEGTVRCKRDNNARFHVSDIEEMTVASTDGLGKVLCRPFDLQGGSLFRIALIYSGDSILLFTDVHHSIFDGTSLLLFMEDISRAYAGEILEAEVYSGYEAALHEQYIRETDALDKAKNYYSELFTDFDGTSLPLGDYPDKSEYSSYDCSLLSLSISVIEHFCSMEKVTRYALFTAAFGFLLAKYQGEEHSVFTTVHNGRSDSRFARSIAMYVKTFPVLCNTDKSDISDYVKETARQLDASRLHDIYSFAEIHHDLGINADIMFVYQDYGFNPEAFCGEEYVIEEVSIDNEKAPFTINVTLKNDMVCISAEYDASRYSRDYIRHFIEAYERVLIGMTTKKALDDIAFADENTMALLETFHGEKTEYEPCSVVDMLHTAMKQYPDNIAIVSGEIRINYRELDEITDRLAAYIIRKGIGKEDVVAILLDRNEMMAICPVAVVKAGAMYQPLDSTYPADRLTFMVKDSGAKLLITPKKLRYLVETDVEEFFTEDIEKLPERGILLPKPASGDAFVILYTSGSTGNPKGCVLEHKNFVHFLRFYNSRFSIDSLSSVAAYASFGFDANMMDLFSTFCAGATLYIIPEDMRLELDRLNRYFDKNCITHAFMTTQVGRQFATSVDNHSLRYLILGGEALTPIAPPKNYTIVNGYGPTETTCGISLFDIDRLYQSVPLGKPNSGVKVYVVDKQFRRVPVGMPGELCIAGPQVSRGYLNLPEKTEEVFVENPFTDELQYKKMYRTGDIVCFLPDGNLRFVGRKDSQVKIRGFRIELAEVEEVIRRLEGIKDVTVAAFDNPDGGKYLVAYVVSDAEVNIDKLNDFIRSEKPAYMVPAVTMQIDRIPLTQNQKVNKKALPKPTVSQNRKYIPPMNDEEKDFCEIMGQTLDTEKYSAEDNFFEVGGSSISATKVLVSALAKGYSVAYSDLFQYPSPRAIAEHIKDMQNPADKLKNDDITQYDYSAINALIQKSNIYSVDEAIDRDPTIRNGKLGNILLTGVTGFLGMHILHDYITYYTGTVTCLIRKNERLSAENRLKSLLFFYFSDDYTEAFEQRRIVCIEAGLNDDDLSNKLENADFDTVIHCAACVKHFVSDDILYRINTEGTRNILQICEERGKRFIHISTYSVSGIQQEGMDKERLSENELYIGQRIDNEYVRTKYLAERYVLEAALRGADVKIMRLGNLMGRISDGEFQINFSTNGFMRDIRGVTALGYSSTDRADKKVDFSPIDCTAEAVLKIADSNLPVLIYHVYNNHLTRASELIEIFIECGFAMKSVSEAEYRRQIEFAAQKYKDDAYMSDIIGGLIAYKVAETGTEPESVDTDNAFTTQILSRLDFIWPKTEKPYVHQMLENLIGMGFFERPKE